MVRLIAADLDETLIRRDRTISPLTVEAIKKAVASGVKFVIATGRGYNSVYDTTRLLGLYGEEGQYTISFNGGAITENRGDRLLYFQGITFSEAAALYKRGLEYDRLCLHVYTKEMVYVRNFYPEEREYLAERQPCTEISADNIDFLKDQDIVKVIYMNTDFSYLRAVQKEIADLTGDMDVSFSSNRYMEFNRKGVSKGEGLVRLCGLLGIDLKDTIAIGDNYNDLSMIKYAGLGVGVSNTIAEMKKECDLITENDCDHDAVAEVINKYVL